MAIEPSLKELTGQVAIVAGGGAAGDGIGNGRAAALLLAREGASVVVVDRRAQDGARTCEMIEAEGGTASAIEADVTSPTDCERVVEHALGTFGGIDVLVNNVGIGGTGSVVDTEQRMWERIMRVNVDSVFLLSKVVIPVMAEGGGAVVNVSSISALRPRGLTAYSTSKGAVIALTQAMAVDHGRQGIRVNCVAPGPVLTPMVGGEDMNPERRESRKNASLLKIEGTGWDVGHAVAFLASPRARYITGQVLIVDGGVTVRGPSR